MKKTNLGLLILIMIYSCNTNLQKENIEFPNDTLNENKIAKTLKTICDTSFSATIDTNIIDTIHLNDYEIIIESIDDTIYKNLYCDFQLQNIKITNPYLKHPDKYPSELEKNQIQQFENYVSRHNDTLILQVDTGIIELVNPNKNEPYEPRPYYYYIQYIKKFKTHLILYSGDGKYFSMIVKKDGDIKILAQNIYINDSKNKLVSNEFFGNELDGGWFNEFKIYEFNNTDLINTIDIKFPVDYKNHSKTWGIRDPIWIANDELIFTYYIGQMMQYDFKYKYLFAKMTIKNKVSS